MKNKFLIKKIAAMTMAGALAATSVTVPTMQNVFAATSADAAAAVKVIYEQTKAKTTEPLEFGAKEDWTKGGEITFSPSKKPVVTPEILITSTLTIDEEAYASLAKDPESYIKVQGAVQVSEAWTWTDCGKDGLQERHAADFEKTENGYQTKISFNLKDLDKDKLMAVILKIVGYNFTGAVTISDTTVSSIGAEDGENKQEQLSYSFAGPSDAVAFDFSALKVENWTDAIEVNIANKIDATIGDAAVYRGKVTIDQDTYDSLSAEGSYLKFQNVLKTVKGTWNQSEDTPIVAQEDFKANEDKTYSADFEASFPELQKTGTLTEVCLKMVGVGAKGSVTFSDINVYSVLSEDAPLLPTAPTVLDDFESYKVDDAGEDVIGWKNEEGWQYDNTISPVIATIDGSQALKLNLDYTKNSDASWSEAKVNKFFGKPGFDLSSYNQLTFDIIYPKEFTNFKTKVFGGSLNKDVVVSGGDELENGMIKSNVVIKFSPSKTKLTSLTLGIVGVNSDFKGDVYVDNITLCQYDPSADFVEITQTPDQYQSPEQSIDQADLTQMPTEVKLIDKKATPATVALRSYLEGLSNSHQVLFGHQNDTHKTVRDGVTSDTEDVTGSISGLVGIDSLSLTGKEMGESTMKENVAKAVEIDKAAAEKGAIITLSAHIPNMSNAKVVKGGDYGYDFIDCDFEESKDLSGNCAEGILDGTYTEQYNAYLDVIADYANQMGDVPILFRPLHECDGGWFWWGSAATSNDTYKALYRYTVDYLTAQGVHNFIYVYSPGGPVTDLDKYLARYPGDDSVDVLAFDYYDDYNYSDSYNETFTTHLTETCENLKKLADEKGKIAAISETGVRIAKPDGSDQEGILVKDNPIKGHNWYKAVGDVAAKTGMPYVLLWANFSDTNFYVPYKYNATLGHELINEFIEYYNQDDQIFANGANFYGNAEKKEVKNTNTTGNVHGYFTDLFSKGVIKEPTTLHLAASNTKASNLSVVLANGDTSVTLPVKSDASKAFSAKVSADDLEKLGKTDVGTVTLLNGKTELAKLTFISFGQDKKVLPANVIDDFELYYGDVDYLNGTFTENSAAACSSAFSLDTENKASGNYGGSFNYTLKSAGAEVWTGRKKSLNTTDFSNYNALTLWLKPDEKDLKTVIQLVSGGQDYEVNVHAFTATKDAKYVTIPFSAFIGKNSKTNDLNPKQIEAFAIWRNSTPKEVTDITSSIVFDDIQFVNVDEKALELGPDGYALTDEPVKTQEQTPDQSPEQKPSEQPSDVPSSETPSEQPSDVPSSETPSEQPSETPSTQPSEQPSETPSTQPSGTPSGAPSSGEPSETPSEQPSTQPSTTPSEQPSTTPSEQPSTTPSEQPSTTPSEQPSITPSEQPSTQPSTTPSEQPSTQPSTTPSEQPSTTPSTQPSTTPSEQPSTTPSEQPSTTPSTTPSEQPSDTPSEAPTPVVKPAKVTGLSGYKRTSSGFTLDWDESENADGYSIERYVSSKKKYVQILTTKFTTKQVTGVASATTHKIRVRAYTLNDGKKTYGSYSKVIKVTTLPKTVSSLSVKSKKSGQVTITWKKVSNASGYQIYRSTSKNGKYTKVKDLTKTTYVDKKGKRGKKYYYKVRAYKKINSRFYGSFCTAKSVKVKK